MNLDINLEDVILLKRSDYDMRNGREINLPDSEGMENLRYIQEEKERRRIQVEEILADPTSPEAIRLKAMQAAGADIYAITIPKSMPQLADVKHPADSMLTITRMTDEGEEGKKKKDKKKKKKKKTYKFKSSLATNEPIRNLVPEMKYDRKVNLGSYFSRDSEEYQRKEEEEFNRSYWVK